MKRIQFYAIFMCLLIFSLPISTAYGISELNAYGSDGAYGFRRATNDKTVVEALVSVSGDDTISPAQVKMEDIDFTSCIDQGNGVFKCTYDEVDMSTSEAASVEIKATLYDDNGLVTGTKTTVLTYDEENPEVIGFETAQIGSEVKITYSLKDTACSDDSCINKCSGIKKIELIGLKTVELNSTKCAYTGTETVILESGTQRVTMNVYDGVGNMGTFTSEPFTVDTTAPAAESDQLNFVRGGKPITTIGMNGLTNVDVFIYIKEDNLAEVIGDLSPLNKVSMYKLQYQNMKALCSDLGGVQQCKWSNIYLMPDQSSGSVIIKMKDKAGTETESALSYSLTSDASAPKVTSIETLCQGTKCYLRAVNNTIKVKISETGSGFTHTFRLNGIKHNLVGLNLGQFSSKYNIEWANECKQESGSWVCYWYNIEVSKPHGQTIKAFIAEGSQDDAGNNMEGLADTSFMVDTKIPEQKELTITSGADLNYLLEGEGMNVVLKVFEDAPVSAIGYFGGILNEGKTYPIACADNGNREFTCEWNRIGSIAPGPQKDAEYQIKVIDFSGNQLLINGTVDIAENEGLAKKYWKVDGAAIPRPKAISKETIAREQKVYFQIPLYSMVKDIKVVNAQLINCTSISGLNLNQDMIVTKQGLFVSGHTTEVNVEYGKVSADCIARIVSVVGRTRVSQPQDIVVSMSIPIVSSTLGSVNDRVADKINTAKDKAKKIMIGPFKMLEKVYDLSKKICDVIQSVEKITEAIHKFAAFKGMQFEAPYMAPAKLTWKALVSDWAKNLLSFNSKNNIFCRLISCDNGPLTLPWNNLYKDMTKKMDSVSVPGMDLHLDVTMWPSDPMDNLILSIISGCIPGIIYNLKKMKEIQCTYIDCLQNQVPTGVPVKYCDGQNAYLQCRFVYGQIFGVIPFAHMLKQLGDFFKNLLHDPLSLIFGASTRACLGTNLVLSLHGLCNLRYTMVQAAALAEAADKIKNAKSLLDDFDLNTESACKKVGL
jgi:hypothetical protein